MVAIIGIVLGLIAVVLGETLRARAEHVGDLLNGDTLTKLGFVLVILSCALQASLALAGSAA